MEKQGVLTKPPEVSGETREAVSGGGGRGNPWEAQTKGPGHTSSHSPHLPKGLS